MAESFLINPQKKQKTTINIIKPEALIESEEIALHQLDNKIDILHKRLNLTAKLKPQNYLSELDNFLIRKGEYAPTFSYAFPESKKLFQRKDELNQLKDTCKNGTLKSPLVKLFDEKVDELLVRHQLLEAYKKQDYAEIEKGNELLRGGFDANLIALSKEKLATSEHRELLGPVLGFRQVKEKIEKRLSDLEIFDVEIVENSANLSRVSVTMGEEIKINISQGVEFREKEVEGIIAHEIDTHLLRYVNGKKSGWKIFSSGTGNYLRDEEGLAIWNAKQKLPTEYESLGIRKKYYLLHEAKNLNFKQLFDLASRVYPQYSLEGRFKVCVRMKKGIMHNGSQVKGIVWGKNKVYLEGYKKLEMLKGIDPRASLGKIKIDDLDFIH
ncbi:MAG: DUF1704 domain-containing protein [Candidatus Peribacteria bacterium]|nr:DUF1704 domain-containing protein [Candidatus Peribacteria bacterium]